MIRYELLVEVNGYEGTNGLSTINIINGGYGWSVGNTFSIGTGGAIGTVTGTTASGGSGFRLEIMSVDGSGGITGTNLTSGGAGYTAGAYFLVDGGTGSYGQILTVNGSGSVLTWSIIIPGSGYTLGDVDFGYITPSVTSATILITGSGYTTSTYTTSGVGFSLTVSAGVFNNFSNAYLDTYDDIGISLNFNIADLNDISSKNSSYSKTITLPDTKLNRATFQYIFGLNSDSTFDATKKSKAWVLRDTVIVFEGYIQLTSITYDRNMGKNEYEVVIYADNDTLFKTIGEKYLTELDLNQYDHFYQPSSIVNSWNGDYTTGYYYPLMDYAYPLDYSLVSASGSGTTSSLSVYNFSPAAYLKPVMDQIFIEAGYSYTSNFFNSDFYKNLIIPFSNKVLTQTPVVSAITIGASGSVLNINPSSTQSTTMVDNSFPTTYKWGNWYCNVETYDPNNLYNVATYSYIHNIPSTTVTDYTQTFTFNIDFRITSNVSTGTPWYDANDTLLLVVKRNVDSAGLTVSGWTNTPTLSQITPPSGGGWPAIQFGGLDYYIIADGSGYIAPGISYSAGGGTISGYPSWKVTGQITSDILHATTKLRFGEEVKFFFMRNGSPAFSNPGTYLRSTSTIQSFIYATGSNILIQGNKIDMAASLPANVKQKDLLGSLMKMFNLYMEPDKMNRNNFIIEPRDDYYRTYQTIKDWSDKLDRTEPIKSQITSDTQARTNIFSYKQDKDIYNESYFNNTHKVFGEYKYEIDNDFITGENNIEPIISPTLIDLLPGSTEIYLPIIANMNNGNYSRPEGMNIRILYRKKKTLSTEHLYFNGTNYSYYPYAGPFDDALNPTVSLNFGQVSSFYDNFNDTIHNLFYDYWQNNMTEISDKNSRILTVSFYLTPLDINQFRFSDLIFFTIDGNDGYYRVNKIMDYDPSTNGITKVELVKALDYNIPTTNAYIPEVSPPISIATSFRPLVGVINLSTSNIIDSAASGVIVAGRGNNVTGSMNIVVGDGNNVTGTNNFITGDSHNTTGTNNFITGDSHNTDGTGNIVLGGKQHNVTGGGNTIIGSGSGITVTDNIMALTSLNELDLYVGTTTFSNITTTTLTAPTGIVLQTGGQPASGNFMVEITNNNGVENYRFVTFNASISVLTSTTSATPYTINFTTLFGTKQATAYIRTTTRGVNQATGAGHKNWYVREQEHFVFWNGSTLNTAPSVTDNVLFTGSGVDWTATTGGSITGYNIAVSTTALIMTIKNNGPEASTVNMKWSFDLEIKYTLADT